MNAETHALHRGFTWGLVVGFLAGAALLGTLAVGYVMLTGQF